jgi:site-specific DNA recombinase
MTLQHFPDPVNYPHRDGTPPNRSFCGEVNDTRLGRTLDAIAYKTLLRKELGLRVRSVSEPFEDSNGALGLLVEGILEIVAHWYSLNLAAETRKDKMEKARKRLWHGAVPTGYCWHTDQPDRSDGRTLIPHPILGEAVCLAFQWYISGKFSDRVIAAKLNDYWFETLISRGKKEANASANRSSLGSG